ncbi:thiamine ABC transporter substrate binding subunit [Moritella sp. Urea-trap-13]|uniref:thiamine ABC transporter substrate binding subunit n=1 Tax=Moritella sp. Urea-trap-13 TaxID=2058327 RepID=UPI000C31BDA4|nr:thiamine ABC transporter substrate binding subunit [Moritella sp. Urea-trap-13]PKH07343.1 thiamine ABC transporter substrate binding subunit [Moritella sp. Urea-trap-13]
MKHTIKKLALCTTLLLPSLSVANAAEKPVLNVYTYDSFASDWGPGPKVKTAFEADCNCTLNLVALEDGVSILNRVKLEGKYTKADVLLGLDNNLMAEAVKTNLLAPHQQDTSKLSLPNAWTNEYFIPFDYGHFAFIYDSEKLANPPKSLAELIERKDLSIIYQDPRTSTPGLGFMLWVKAVYGDQAPQAWQQIADKTVTITKGWSQAYGMFLKGESDMVLSYTTSPAYHMIAESEFKYKAVEFTEGHYQQTEVVARLKDAANPELADQFMAFVLSPAFQDVIATGNWMLPAKQASALPSEFEQLISPAKTIEFTPEEVAQSRKSWVKEWRNAVTQ